MYGARLDLMHSPTSDAPGPRCSLQQYSNGLVHFFLMSFCCVPVMGVKVISFYCSVSAKYLFYISNDWVLFEFFTFGFLGEGGCVSLLFLISKHRLVFSK